MTESERAELLLGVRSTVPPYDHDDFGPSEMKTYAPLIAWIEGPLLTAVQKLAEALDEYEIKATAMREALPMSGQPWSPTVLNEDPDRS